MMYGYTSISYLGIEKQAVNTGSCFATIACLHSLCPRSHKWGEAIVRYPLLLIEPLFKMEQRVGTESYKTRHKYLETKSLVQFHK
jgi:hypothetical protein